MNARHLPLIAILFLSVFACNDPDPEPANEEEEEVSPYLNRAFAGHWRHVYDRSFGFEIKSTGHIIFLRTPIETGVLSPVTGTTDSITAQNGEMNIFSNELCTSPTSKTYAFVNDTLKVNGLFEEVGHYVKTIPEAQYYEPSSNQFQCEITTQDISFHFSNNPHKYSSSYSLNESDLYIVAEMNDIECLAGPQNNKSQIRYLYFHIYPFQGTGVYMLNGDGATYASYNDFPEDVGYHVTLSNVITLEITEYDESSGLLEGQFSGSLREFNGDRILQISEGSFSYQLFVEGPDYSR